MRYYSSGTGRFLRPDPAEDGVNLYVYCDNDPLNYVDPFGLMTQGYSRFIAYRRIINNAKSDLYNLWVYRKQYTEEAAEETWEDTKEFFENWQELSESDGLIGYIVPSPWEFWEYFIKPSPMLP